MRVVLTLLAALALVGCSDDGGSVETFATDRSAAEAAVADCDAGRRTPGCDAAREGLAEAKRRDREALYRQAH
ncbi:EexN family lipoprotein [Brevundimonas naejangsanensis]|uniref:EexN family lipoprotein n=1 Tax=Brevundimonas naejangsanensis TaxID=588932 RepID=UPI0026F10B7C|nr:EexN family lipoprotein [Brevundimonas naejangsanensis]